MNDLNVGDVSAKIDEARARIGSVIIRLDHLWDISDAIGWIPGEPHPLSKELGDICLLLDTAEAALGAERISKGAGL